MINQMEDGVNVGGALFDDWTFFKVRGVLWRTGFFQSGGTLESICHSLITKRS
jgi:hypothetical protein